MAKLDLNYNEEMEQEISRIILDDEIEEKIPVLLEYYEKTKYIGVLSTLGQIYYIGMYELEKANEEKGLEYLTQAANLGNEEAIHFLGNIYIGKAQSALEEANKWYSKLSSNDKIAKYCMGTNLIANYLISTSGSLYNFYESLIDGLRLVAESNQLGYNDAGFILSILNQEEYKKDIEAAERNTNSKLIQLLYGHTEDDFIIPENYDDIEFVDANLDDEEYDYGDEKIYADDLNNNWVVYDNKGLMKNYLFNTKEDLIYWLNNLEGHTQYISEDDFEYIEKPVINGIRTINLHRKFTVNNKDYYIYQIGSSYTKYYANCFNNDTSLEKLDETKMSLSLDEFKESYNISKRLIMMLKRANIQTVKDIAMCDSRGILGVVLGRTSLNELLEKLEELSNS